MSILYRTRGWLTLDQLLPAWARELADDKINAGHVESDLTHFLIEDMINGRLDDTGPLADGRRLGLRIITPDNRAGYLDGQQARELLMPAGTPAEFSLVSHPLVVMKEAVLDFAGPTRQSRRESRSMLRHRTKRERKISDELAR